MKFSRLFLQHSVQPQVKELLDTDMFYDIKETRDLLDALVEVQKAIETLCQRKETF